MTESEENKRDGRIKNGGYRPGAGRKAGSGIEAVNMVIRMPLSVLKEAEEAGIVKGKRTKLIIEGFRSEIKNIMKKKAQENKDKGTGNSNV